MRLWHHWATRARRRERGNDKEMPGLGISFWGSIVAAMLAGLFTILGIAWQLNVQRQQFEKTLLLDGAYNTAQETSRLLSDGYSALARLARESHGKSWEQGIDGPWVEFMEFHRQWRQRLIAHHFQLARYLGQDLADKLIHLNEIHLHQDYSYTKDSELCALQPADMEHLVRQAECYLRVAAVTQSIGESDPSGGMSDFIQDKQQYDSLRGRARQLIEEYDKSTIRFLRAIEARLIQFRGGPYVVNRHPAE